MKIVLYIIFFVYSIILFAQEKPTKLIALEENLKMANTDSLKVDAYIALGRYQVNRDFHKIKGYLTEIKAILRTATYDTRDHLSRFNRQTGIVYRRQGDFPKALEYYNIALNLAKDINDSVQMSYDYNNIGNMYRSLNDYESALPNLYKAAQLKERFKKYSSLGVTYEVIARTYIEMNNLDSAKVYINKYKKLFSNFKTNLREKEMFFIESNFFFKKGDLDKALKLQLRYLEFAKKDLGFTKRTTSSLLIAEIYFKTGKYNSALDYLNEVILFSREKKIYASQIEAYKLRSELFQKLGKTKEALNDYKKYNELKQELISSARIKELKEKELNLVFEKQQLRDSLKYEEERKLLKLENQKAKTEKQLYILLVIIGAFISLFGVRYFRKRWINAKKREEELKKKLTSNSQENKQRISILNSDIDNLSAQIDSKKDEIAHLMTESLQHLKNKERLVDDLKKIAANDSKLSLKSILADLNSEALDDHKLVVIKTHLEELNYDYFNRLKTKHPELTEIDLEICSYLKLGFGRKEIAKLRYTTTDAVKKSRYRIRKKMNLNSDIDLEDYIKSI